MQRNSQIKTRSRRSADNDQASTDETHSSKIDGTLPNSFYSSFQQTEEQIIHIQTSTKDHSTLLRSRPRKRI